MTRNEVYETLLKEICPNKAQFEAVRDLHNVFFEADGNTEYAPLTESELDINEEDIEANARDNGLDVNQYMNCVENFLDV